MSKIKFNGWDWTELARVFGIDENLPKYQLVGKLNKKTGFFLGEGRLYKDIQKGIDSLTEFAWYQNNADLEWRAKYTSQDRAKVQDIRRFVRAISKYHDYQAPVWAGLARVKSDLVFLQFTREFLGWMWT